MSNRDVIFIIGTMRSGTSALTRVLSLCGCSLPELVQGARSFNPTGNWDPVEGLRINNDFMFSHRTILGDPEMRFHETPIETEAKEHFIERIEQFLRSCPGASALVIKDQSITDLMSYWITAVRRLGNTPNFVIPVRRLEEYMLSMQRITSSVPLEYHRHVWLKYNLLAERNSRQVPRLFIEYSNLMSDWELELTRVSKTLSIPLQIQGNASVQRFLDPHLHHHRIRSQDTPIDPLISRWCESVYKIFSAAAVDKPLDKEQLDSIFYEFTSTERSFRVSSNFFRTNFDPVAFTEWVESLATLKAGTDF